MYILFWGELLHFFLPPRSRISATYISNWLLRLQLLNFSISHRSVTVCIKCVRGAQDFANLSPSPVRPPARSSAEPFQPQPSGENASAVCACVNLLRVCVQYAAGEPHTHREKDISAAFGQQFFISGQFCSTCSPLIYTPECYTHKYTTCKRRAHKPHQQQFGKQPLPGAARVATPGQCAIKGKKQAMNFF